MRSCTGVCVPASAARQRNSLDADAGILQRDGGHFRSYVFRQVGDADPIDLRSRAAARRRAEPLSIARSALRDNRACHPKDSCTGPPRRSSWIRDRKYFPSGHRIRCAAVADLFAEAHVFTPPVRASPARKNMRVERLRLEGSFGFVSRPQRENLSRIGRGKKQFSAGTGRDRR